MLVSNWKDCIHHFTIDYVLGKNFYSNSEYSLSIDAFTQAIKLDSISGDAYFNRGLSYLAIKEGENALTDLEAAYQYLPNSFDVSIALAQAHTLVEHYGDCYLQVERSRPLIETDYHQAQIYYWRGICHEGRQDTSMAIEAWEDLLAMPVSSEIGNLQAGAREHLNIIYTPTPIHTETPTPTSLPEEISDIDPTGNSIPMRLVPAGEFTMGSDTGPDDEKPEHEVHLDTFFIDKFEVTNAHYNICVAEKICYQPLSTDHIIDFNNHPVVNVTWEMAMTYCEWREGYLPSEAQWEKAARGTDSRTYPWGNEINCNKANYSDCTTGTTPVGSYEEGKSVYGVYDMAGNVWEWVADWYSETYYFQSPYQNPTGPSDGTDRVLKGGAWFSSMNDSRSSNRADARIHREFYGFRCAKDAP